MPQHTVKLSFGRGKLPTRQSALKSPSSHARCHPRRSPDNPKEALALHLEGEHPADFGLAPNPTILVTLELVPEYASA